MELAEDVTPENVVATGIKVGELAREYFGEFSLVDYDFNKSKMIGRTLELMNSETKNIAEASFLYDALFCAVDILHRNGVYEIRDGAIKRHRLLL